MASLVKFVREQLQVVQSVGGYSNAFRRFLRECNVRVGTFVGADQYGNRYYENSSYFMGRNRFVDFPYEGRFGYDASQIPPEWHRWMQYMTDEPPSTHPPEKQKFYLPHKRNMSGSKGEYVPYSTTLPKIHAWKPPSSV